MVYSSGLLSCNVNAHSEHSGLEQRERLLNAVKRQGRLLLFPVQERPQNLHARCCIRHGAQRIFRTFHGFHLLLDQEKFFLRPLHIQIGVRLSCFAFRFKPELETPSFERFAVFELQFYSRLQTYYANGLKES